MGKTHEMKKIFLDTDVILDFIMKREPFHLASSSILELAKQDAVKVYASASCFTNLYYVFRKIAGGNKAKQAISSMLLYLNILDVNGHVIKISLESSFSDFEDAVQYYTAINNKMDILVTRNISDYILDDIPVMLPEEFLKTF